jgi:hypothetical protein
MDTESGDYEEEEDANVAKRANELERLNGPAEEIIWPRISGLRYCVVKDHPQRRNASQRVDAF